MPTWEEYKKKKNLNQDKNRIIQIHESGKATMSNANTNNNISNTNTSNNAWNRVMNTASNILKDTGTFFKNLTLGAQSGGISAIGQTEFLSQQRSENYRRFQQQATEIEQKRTKQGIIDFENKKNENAKLVNGVLVRNQPKINDSAIMQRVNTKQEEINQKMAQNAENAKTKVGKYLAGDVAPSMGQSLVGTGLDIIAPGMGSAYRTLSYGGNYTQDALKAGMNEKQSAMYGLTMAGVETAMDTVGDKLKGVAIGEAKKAKGFKEFIKASAKELGINSFFEGAGEALTEPLQEAVKQAYGGKADYENILQRMGKSFLAGATSELLMTGASLGYGGSINVVNKLQNGEQVSTQEISKALKEINQKEEIDIEKVLVDKLGFTTQDLYKNTDVEQKVNDKIDNISTEISQNEIRGILPKKQLATMENKPISEQTQQVISNEGKMAENQTSSQTLGNEKYSIKMPNSNYKFVKSGDEKIDNFRQDVSQNWNNSKDTQKLVSTIETIMKDKGVAVRLDANLKDADGNIADGKYENGTITINPNSKRAFEYIATHELTHAIGTKQMLDMVQRYRQDNNEFNSKVETLLKNYNATELTEEALADVSAQLFGTQEFIANVKNTNPNLFQKIYNEIKYLWHQFRGYKDQNQFIEDLYNKWTQAYNSKAELNQNAKYMVVGENAVNIDIDKKNEAQKRLDAGENKYLVFAETGWFRNKDGKMKTEIDDSESEVILNKSRDEILQNNNLTLPDILKHQKLYDAYPELEYMKVVFEKDPDYYGQYDPNTNQINVDIERYIDNETYNKELERLTRELKSYDSKDALLLYDTVEKINELKEKTKKEIENIVSEKKPNEKLRETLIHEIQHWVQRKEGFTMGSNERDWQYIKQNPEKIIKKRNEIAKQLKNIKDKNSEDYKFLSQKLDRFDRLIDNINNKNVNKLYKKTGGEEEGYFTADRMNMSEAMRKSYLPEYTDNDTILIEDVIESYKGAKNGKYKSNSESRIINEQSETSTDRIHEDKSTSVRSFGQRGQESSGTLFKNRGAFTNESKNNNRRDGKNNQGLEESSSFNLQENNYRGSHQIENAKRITELDLSDIENRVKKVNGYLTKQDYTDLNKLKKILKFPNEKVKIYRASPVHELNSGDWVTTDRLYAKNVAKENGGKVYEYEIDASELYYPDNVKDLPSLHRLSSFQYVGDARYLKENTEWQEYLEEHFNTEGTRTYSSQIRNGLPQESVLRQNVTNSKKYTTKKETDTEIAKILETPVTRQKPKDRMWAIMKANILDKGIVFEDLSKRAKNRELEAKWDYTLTSGARAQNAIGNKRYDLSGNVISKGLTEIMDEVGDKINDFQNYMYHQLNVDRMTLKDRLGIDNKPVFGDKIGADYSRRAIAEYEKSNPKFKEWAKDVYDYLKADKAELVKNGVISEELSRKFEELYPHYVPIQRADKLGNAINVPLDTRRTGINTPIKKAKGGSSDINPLFQTMANRTMQTYRASARNSLGVELKNTLQKLNEFKSNESNVADLDNIIETVSNEAQTDELLKASKDGRLPTFTVFENGNKVTFDISEDIYDALKPKDSSSLFSKTSKTLSAIGNLRRGVLTEYNPLFSITNTLKDTQDVLMNSQHATKTYKKYPEAYSQIIKKGYWYNEYIQNGGGQNTYFKDGDFEVKKTGKLPKAKQALSLPLEAISKVNNALEMAPRLAEYIASREQGRSIQTSMLDASRVTTNFKAGGDITKFANRNGATFLNAGVQGTMQAVRNIREANAQGLKGWAVLACKMAVAGAPVLFLNHMFWEDDEDYKQLQDYVKDSYYIIDKRDDGTFIRIPKGRTLAVIQKVVSNVDKYMNNNNELNIDTFSKDFWETLKFGVENLAPNNPLDNNVLSPIIQTITNTSWYGEDIVPQRLQNVPKAEQYDESTDKLSKWLGEKLNVSPLKVNYLLDQYSGGVGDILLPLGTPQAENTPLEDKFVTDPVLKSKYPGEFFEKADEIEIASNSMYATDSDIVKGKYMSEIQGELSKLYKQKREIQNSTDSDKIKKEKIKDVQRQINDLSRESMEIVDKAKVNSKTAVVGDKQYYKDDEGEWQKVKESQIVEGLSTETYADYKNKISVATDKKRIEKQSDTAQLNNTEQIEILKNSKYTDEEKEKIYANYIGDNDTVYSDLKKLTNNININQYLDYKSSEFKADDNPNSNVVGKTISGSKKKKLIKYINDSKFSTVEKLYIYGRQYELTEQQKKQFLKYVDKAGIKGKERTELIKKMKGTTEYENGALKW